MKKYRKIIISIIICLCIFMITTTSFSYDWKSEISATFENSKTYDEVEATSSIREMVAAAINIMQIVGTGIAIILLIVLAMKYMIAAPGDRADIKKHATVYLIGAIVLFASTGILEIILDFTKNFESTGNVANG